jgi:hypothetical protein
MKYALFIVEIPVTISETDTHAAATTLTNFLDTVRGKAPAGAIPSSMLNAATYLCDLEHNGLHQLMGLVAAAKERGYQSRTLFFDQKLPFVITPK